MPHTIYTWNPCLVQPYESTWSLLQKFAKWNACGTRDIQREFGLPIKRTQPQNWSDRDRNLHGWGALNPSLLQRALGLTDIQVMTASTLTYIRVDEAKVLASRSLRLCPACIGEGFHSPLHQLLFITTCPIHHCHLTIQCVACGKPTAPYALTRQSFHTAYGCGECGTSWWGGKRSVTASLAEKEARESLLGDIGQWLGRRKQDQSIEAGIVKLARFIETDHEFYASVRQLPHRWADVLGVTPPRQLTSSQRDSDRHIVLQSQVTEIDGGELRLSQDKPSFGQVYRAIRRHLTRHVHKYHRGCFEKMGKYIWFPIGQRELEVRHFCQAAYALLLWRMLWEQVDVPQRFFSRQLRLVHPKIEFAPEWIPPSVSREVTERLFGMECLRTYRRCCELAVHMEHKDRITFPVWRLSTRRIGEWIVQRAKSGDTQKIHWWWPRRWESTLCFQPHHTKQSQKSRIRILLDHSYYAIV